ncbi:MAG TPA: hypothetical protein VM513_12455 [Kofleriaceae bacterium]|nr:hypothetical protein [Kofleriaceae bacterium]
MIDLTPLDTSTLSAAAQRALGPGPGRMMASKGMLPLPPADQVAVLYQLSLDADVSIAGAARATAAGLPEKLLSGTLADPALDPRVLHFFGQQCGNKAAVFDAIALNPAVADATLAMLAGRGGAREVDQLAQNEQRLLRHPEIIAAMYMNRNARMSTIDRVVELAVRNQVRVPGLACWDEVARALSGAPASNPEEDAMFAHAADALSGEDAELTAGAVDGLDDQDAEAAEAARLAERSEQVINDRKVSIGSMSVPSKIRLALLGNAYARSVLVRDPIKLVAVAAIKSPAVSSIEARNYAGNTALDAEVVRYISQRRDWVRDPDVRRRLIRNPKTPIAEASKLLPFLREKELVTVTRSKGVPSALVAQARKILMQRKGGAGK